MARARGSFGPVRACLLTLTGACLLMTPAEASADRALRLEIRVPNVEAGPVGSVQGLLVPLGSTVLELRELRFRKDGTAVTELRLTEEVRGAWLIATQGERCGQALWVQAPGAIPETLALSVELAPRGAARGVVRDASKRPSAEAPLRLRASHPDRAVDYRLRRLDIAGAKKRGDLLEALGRWEVESDEAGAFAAGGLCAGEWSVRVEVPGTVPPKAQRIVATPTAAPLSFELPKGRSVVGRVVERTALPGVAGEEPAFESRPIAGALITGKLTGARTIPIESDAKGRFSLHGLPPRSLSLAATAEGFGDFSVELPATQASAEIVLERLGRVLLDITDARTLGGIDELTVQVLAKKSRGLWKKSGEPIESEGADGRHVLEAMPPGLRSLRIEKEGYLPATLEPFTLAPGGEQGPLSVALAPGRIVRGRVLRSSDDEPVVGAEIKIAAPQGRRRGSSWSWPTAKTGTDGRFVLEGLPSTELTLLASCSGFAAGEGASRAVPLGGDWDDAQGDAVVFELDQNASILVHVEDSVGAPISGVPLEGHAKNPSARATCVTGDEGDCELVDLPPGLVELFRTDARVLRTPFARVELERGEQRTITYRESGALVRVFVHHEGRPVPSRVTLGSSRSPRGGMDWQLEHVLRDVSVGTHPLFVAYVGIDRDGVFQTSKFSQNRDHVLVVPEGVDELSHEIAVTPRSVETSDGEEEAVVVTGRVIDSVTGQGLDVGVSASGIPGASAPSSPDGQFSLALQGTGTWRLSARVSEDLGYANSDPVEVIVADGAVVQAPDPLVILAGRLPRIVFRVMGDAGGMVLPLVGAKLRPLAGDIYVDGRTVLSKYNSPGTGADENGRAFFWEKEPGPLDVLCVMPGWGLGFVPDVEPTTELDAPEPVLLLPKGGSVELIWDPTQPAFLVEPFTGRGWRLPIARGPVLPDLVHPIEGGMRVHGLPEGSWQVEVEGRAPERVEIRAGASTRVDLR